MSSMCTGKLEVEMLKHGVTNRVFDRINKQKVTEMRQAARQAVEIRFSLEQIPPCGRLSESIRKIRNLYAEQGQDKQRLWRSIGDGPRILPLCLFSLDHFPIVPLPSISPLHTFLSSPLMAPTPTQLPPSTVWVPRVLSILRTMARTVVSAGSVATRLSLLSPNAAVHYSS